MVPSWAAVAKLYTKPWPRTSLPSGGAGVRFGGVRVCTTCRARFRGTPARCPFDGTELIELPDPLIGQQVAGRYVVQEKIGVGGMGSVYRASDEPRSRDVALKFLAPELCVDSTNRKRFLREAKAANRIDHEHIIDITDYGQTDDGLVYLVMEYLDGEGLNEPISRGRFPIRRALQISLQVAEALARAHELGVIHRDIKPDNIFLLRGFDGDYVKLLDFGLAKMKGELRLTATGTVFGTPEYMAPEQARGAPTTPSVDLYATGCVLFEMLTGRLPFRGNTPDLILKHMREPAPTASSVARGIPADVDDLVLRLLAKEPEGRPATSYALASELTALLKRHGGGHRAQRTAGFQATTSVDAPFSVEDAWLSRVDHFRRLVGRAHPRGDEPPWIQRALTELDGNVDRMREVRQSLVSLSERIAEREKSTRAARLRFGRALDELGSDESRVLGELAELDPAFRDSQVRIEALERPVRRGWATLSRQPDEGARLSPKDVESLIELGMRAAELRDAAVELEGVARRHIELERERDDLRFQVSQLKGRLGTINAESELEVEHLRGEVTGCDAELRQLAERALEVSRPLYEHLLKYPECRGDALLGAGAETLADGALQ